MSAPLMHQSRNPHRQRSARERVFEIIPAALVWLSLGLAVYFSFTHPAWAAVYIIVFDVYWVLKAINTTLHLLSSYNHYQHDLTMDWFAGVKMLRHKEDLIRVLTERKAQARRAWRGLISREIERVNAAQIKRDYDQIYHVVLFPFVDESFELLRTSVEAIRQSNYRLDRVIILLAAEERAAAQAQATAQKLHDAYQDVFRGFLVSTHPDNLPGEIRGKSANASFATEHVLLPWLAQNNIPLENVIMSNLDSDTVVHRQYLARVTYEWLLAADPHRRSYQPITLYNNNMWDSPALVRVVAVANSFWQFMESSRPDRLRTFSSHSMSLKTLREVGFWKKEIVNEDGFIFWQCYLHFNGQYSTVPLFIPVSMDTCVAEDYKQTLINQYKQKRRWAYNVEYWPHLVPKLLGNKKIPLPDRLYKFWQYVEGNYNWATASIVIATMGFLPSFLGDNFTGTVLGYNLPYATRLMMNIALVFLIASVYVNMILLPPRPAKYKWTRTAAMYAQWVLVPFISIIWGSIPSLEAQTRLALGKYMEFWVTPKPRSVIEKSEIRISKPETALNLKN